MRMSRTRGRLVDKCIPDLPIGGLIFRYGPHDVPDWRLGTHRLLFPVQHGSARNCREDEAGCGERIYAYHVDGHSHTIVRDQPKQQRHPYRRDQIQN